MFRSRARSIFKNIVSLLHQLGKTFASARVNAGLGESILREMEKTASCLARDDTENAASRRVDGTVTAKDGDQVLKDVTPATGIGSGVASEAMTPVQPIFEGTNVSSDPAILDNFDVDVDLFGFFDPSFDLGAIDTALEANLDMGIPQNWTLSWNHVQNEPYSG